MPRQYALPCRGERAYETHGGAALYAVDQDLGKTPDLGLGRRAVKRRIRTGSFMSGPVRCVPRPAI